MSYQDDTQFILNETMQLVEELESYNEKGQSNASQAQRIRKATLTLEKLFKDFRKDSVEHHRK